jgi:hypothetical protein
MRKPKPQRLPPLGFLRTLELLRRFGCLLRTMDARSRMEEGYAADMICTTPQKGRMAANNVTLLVRAPDA